MVVSTVFLIFWLLQSIKLTYDIPSFDDRSRDSAKNTVMPHCEVSSSLFLWEASRNPSILNGPVSGNIEASLAVTWSVPPNWWETWHRQLLEKLPSKHNWKICGSIGTVSHTVTNFSVPVSFCTLFALKEYNGGLPSCFVPLAVFLPTHQVPFFDWLQCAVRFGDLVSNEFFILWRAHHSNLLIQLENLFWVWSEHVVPCRFHLFQRDHPQMDWWFLPRIFL